MEVIPLESPTLATYISSSTSKITRAQEPETSVILFLFMLSVFLIKAISVFLNPELIAALGF